MLQGSRRRLLWIQVALTAATGGLLLAGCTGGGPFLAAVVPLTANYYPFNAGDTRTYRETFVANGGPQTTTIVQRVGAGGLEHLDANGQIASVQAVQVGPDGILFSGYQNFDQGAPAFGSLRINPPLKIPFGLAAGQTSTQTVTVDSTASVEGSTRTFTITFRGLETVTVPAGTFTKVARIELEPLSQTDIATGIPFGQTTWLAPDLGQIKAVTSLGATTSTVELASATIQGHDIP